MSDNILRYLAGGMSADEAIRRETLQAAVIRQIFCGITDEVLDVRTAVCIETTGQAFVLSGAAWDDNEQALRDGIAKWGWEITDVIDGREMEGSDG